MAHTIESLAELYSNYFEKRERNNEESFYCLKGFHPDELKDIVYKIHNEGAVSMAPDDYKYQFIYDMFQHISEGNDEDSIEADVYNSNLLHWLSSRNDRTCYCDVAIECYGTPEKIEMIALISQGQLYEKLEVYNFVYSFLEDRLEALED